MKKRLLTFAAQVLFLAFAAAILHSNAIAEDIILIKAEGVAPRIDDIAEAKKNALNDAIKNAVTQAAKSLYAMASNEGAKDEAIAAALSDPGRFIDNYRILSEETGAAEGAAAMAQKPDAAGTEVLHIWIELTINAGQLKHALGLTVATEAQILRLIKVTVLDIADYSTFSSIISALRNPAFAREVLYDSFLRGRIQLTVKTTEDALLLRENLSAALADALVAVVNGEREVIIRPSQKGEPVE